MRGACGNLYRSQHRPPFLAWPISYLPMSLQLPPRTAYPQLGILLPPVLDWWTPLVLFLPFALVELAIAFFFSCTGGKTKLFLEALKFILSAENTVNCCLSKRRNFPRVPYFIFAVTVEKCQNLRSLFFSEIN